MNKEIETQIIDNIKCVSSKFLKKEVDPLFLNKGSKTYVYKISDDWVIKLNSQSDQYLKVEKVLINICLEKGINAPKIEEIGNFIVSKVNEKEETTLITINYALQRYIKGTELTDRDVTKKIFTKLNLDLKQLHAINIGGFGRLDLSTVGIFESWSEYLKTHITDEYIEIAKVEFAQEYNTIIDFVNLIVLDQGKFCFGDLKFEHIFIDNGSYLQLADFDYCLAGDPMYDFATYDYYCDFYDKNKETKKWIRYNTFDEDLVLNYKKLIAIKKLGVYSLRDTEDPEKKVKAKKLLMEYYYV